MVSRRDARKASLDSWAVEKIDAVVFSPWTSGPGRTFD
jgi:hypothetical protein